MARAGLNHKFILLIALILNLQGLPIVGDEGPILHIINVGYGDAFLVTTPMGPTFLIDGGYPQYYQTIAEYIKDQKINTIDYLIMTHSHPDHAGSLPKLIENFRVLNIWTNADTYLPLEKAAKKKNIAVTSLRREDIIQINPQIKIKILNPSDRIQDPNEDSLAFIIDIQGWIIFFTADIGIETQNRIVQENILLKSDILKLPHHGNGLSEKFLERIKPDYAILSVGPNPYGAPQRSVLNMILKHQIQLIRTDLLGNIKLKPGDKYHALSDE